jgi:hypothetical protein
MAGGPCTQADGRTVITATADKLDRSHELIRQDPNKNLQGADVFGCVSF